jgi:hypothetical protein
MFIRGGNLNEGYVDGGVTTVEEIWHVKEIDRRVIRSPFCDRLARSRSHIKRLEADLVTESLIRVGSPTQGKQVENLQICQFDSHVL